MSNKVEVINKLDSKSIWEAVDQYEIALRSNSTVHIADFLPDRHSSDYPSVLAELLRIGLEYDWSRGQPPELTALLGAFPELQQMPEVLESVAFEDFRQRKLHGHPVEAESYRERYGIDSSTWLATWELAQSAIAASSDSNERSSRNAVAIDTIRAAAADTDAPRVATGTEMRSIQRHFPAVGTTWGPFVIVRELGSGSFSRVYACRQTDLASRYVALKITGMPLGESQRLAKLQHASIMPLYSVHQHDGLFALCMPLLGAVTLKEIVDRLAQAEIAHAKS